MAKKYDPMWEYANIKVPLQGAEEDVDANCPVCHVRLHVGLDARAGAQVECGLCGEALEIVREADGFSLCRSEAE